MTGSRVKLTYLGQAGFLVEGGESRFLIDPYLSNYVVDSGIGAPELFSRAFPAPFQPAGLRGIDLVFVTHDHADHCDPHTLLPLIQVNPQLKIICPKPAADHLLELGVSQSSIIVPQDGILQTIAGLEYYPIPAAHYGFDQDSVTGAYAYFAYVIKFAGSTLFHAGDTIDYPDFAEKILKHTESVDVACLPVNGRDAKRESMDIVGNMNGAEALSLATRLNSKVLIPIHNDLFAFNSEDPAILQKLYDQQAPPLDLQWLNVGDSIER